MTLARRLVFVAASVPVVLIWREVADAGLGVPGALIGIVVTLALLFLALRPRQKAGPTRHIVPADAFGAAYGVIEADFMPVLEKGLRPFERNKTTDLMSDNVRLQAAKLAWIATAMALEKTYPGFRLGNRFVSLGQIAGVEFRKHLRSSLDLGGPVTLPEMVAKETEQCIAVLDRAISGFAREQPNAMVPVFRMVEGAFPLAVLTTLDTAPSDAQVEAAYWPIFRKAVLAATGG